MVQKLHPRKKKRHSESAGHYNPVTALGALVQPAPPKVQPPSATQGNDFTWGGRTSGVAPSRRPHGIGRWRRCAIVLHNHITLRVSIPGS